jgi:hypothetical protein
MSEMIKIHFQPSVLGADNVLCCKCGTLYSTNDDAIYASSFGYRGRTGLGEEAIDSPHYLECPKCGLALNVVSAIFDGTTLRLKDESTMKTSWRVPPIGWKNVPVYLKKAGRTARGSIKAVLDVVMNRLQGKKEVPVAAVNAVAQATGVIISDYISCVKPVEGTRDMLDIWNKLAKRVTPFFASGKVMMRLRRKKPGIIDLFRVYGRSMKISLGVARLLGKETSFPTSGKLTSLRPRDRKSVV